MSLTKPAAVSSIKREGFFMDEGKEVPVGGSKTKLPPIYQAPQRLVPDRDVKATAAAFEGMMPQTQRAIFIGQREAIIDETNRELHDMRDEGMFPAPERH